MTAPQDPFRTPGQGSTPGYPGQPGQPAPASSPGYGAPPSGGFGDPPPRGPARNGLGVAALVLGILALITFWTLVGGILFGLLAIILGLVGRGRAKRGEATNGGMALAGVILGALGLLFAAGLIAVGASFLNSDTGKKLKECADAAGQSQAAIEQCQREFAEDLTG